MGDVVPFRRGRAMEETREIGVVASHLIEALGVKAGHDVRCFARLSALGDTSRRRLLAVADEIDRVQGFGWWFSEDELA
jgi:hypothetical protein